MTLFKNTRQLITDLIEDNRIPSRDKKIILILLILILSPLDLIPDWIAFYGQIDDLIAISLIMDYFFQVLDSRVLLSHWPWGMKSFARFRAIARALEFFVPRFLKKWLWTYLGDPY